LIVRLNRFDHLNNRGWLDLLHTLGLQRSDLTLCRLKVQPAVICILPAFTHLLMSRMASLRLEQREAWRAMVRQCVDRWEDHKRWMCMA